MILEMRLWNLELWFSAVGITNISQQVIQLVEQKKIYNPHGIRWGRNVFNWKAVGIAEREDAVVMVAVLNHHAKLNSLSYMNCQNIREHSEIFFRSRACKPNNGWLELDFNELEGICPSSGNEIELIAHVHPHPQDHLFGRDRDMERLLQILHDRQVVAVVGNGGEGKTALVWHTAQKTKNEHIFQCFDWVTDKRFVLDLETQEEVHTGEQGIDADFASHIIDSMLNRFRHVDPSWEKVIDEIPLSDRRRKLCQELLVAGNFLLIVDNIETTSAHNQIVRFLLDLLTDSKSSTRSRALITSRDPVMKHAINQQGIYKLKGLELYDALQMMNAVQRDFEHKLSEDECRQIAEKTAGNPLFILVSLYRYNLEPTKEEFRRILPDIEAGRSKAFDFLFKPLVERLRVKGSLSLARFIAASSTMSASRQFIEQAWQKIFIRVFQQNADQVEIAFVLKEAIVELIHNGIISVNSQDIYSMHPLIGRYFRGLTGD